MDKIKTYSLLAFSIIIVQVFYDFQEAIFFIKTATIILSLIILYKKIRLDLKAKNIFIYAYFISIYLSFIFNLDTTNLKDFLIGFAVLLVPIGFLNATLLTKNNQYTSKAIDSIHLYTVYGAGVVILYTYYSGGFVEYQGLGQRFVTDAISPSIISLNANLVIIYCLLHINKKRKLLLIPIIVSFILIVLSISKSGIIISLAALVYIGILRKKYVPIGLTLIFMSIIIISIADYLPAYDIIMDYIDSGSIENFTGRTAIWDTCKMLIAKKEICGYGYNSSAGLLTKFFPYFLVEQAHSGYYESMINLGYLGTFVLILYVLKVLTKSIINFSIIRNTPLLSFSFFIVLMELLRVPTEAAFCQANNIVDVFIFFFNLFIIDYYPYKKKNIKLN